MTKSNVYDALTRESLRDEYVFCRTVGHSWEEVVANDLPRPEFGYRFSVRCTRCTTQRHQIINQNTGGTEGCRYAYVDGYKIDEKVSRSEMRLEWASRRNYDFITAARSKRKKK